MNGFADRVPAYINRKLVNSSPAISHIDLCESAAVSNLPALADKTVAFSVVFANTAIHSHLFTLNALSSDPQKG